MDIKLFRLEDTRLQPCAVDVSSSSVYSSKVPLLLVHLASALFKNLLPYLGMVWAAHRDAAVPGELRESAFLGGPALAPVDKHSSCSWVVCEALEPAPVLPF